jgi:hypothetical protein
MSRIAAGKARRGIGEATGAAFPPARSFLFFGNLIPGDSNNLKEVAKYPPNRG